MNYYFAKKQRIKASLTVEAALAFPVFFYAIMALCCLFLFLETKAAVRKSMLDVSRSLSVYGDLIEAARDKAESGGTAVTIAAEIIGGASVELLFSGRLENYPVAINSIKGGAAGVSLAGSDLMTTEHCIELVCGYRFKSPASIFGISGPKVEQRVTYRYFTGRKVECLLEEEAKEEHEEEPEEETVFKTENGVVYHIRLTCPSLKLNISEVLFADVGEKRNEQGGRYYPCEKCASGERPGSVFITTDGDRYHYRINCSGLKRTITEIKKSEIGSLRPCKRCGEKEN